MGQFFQCILSLSFSLPSSLFLSLSVCSPIILWVSGLGTVATVLTSQQARDFASPPHHWAVVTFAATLVGGLAGEEGKSLTFPLLPFRCADGHCICP